MGIIEPSPIHYYQPSWTMVGGGLHDFKDSMRDQASVMPRDADWIKDRATAFKPEENKVITEKGEVSACTCVCVCVCVCGCVWVCVRKSETETLMRVARQQRSGFESCFVTPKAFGDHCCIVPLLCPLSQTLSRPLSCGSLPTTSWSWQLGCRSTGTRSRA